MDPARLFTVTVLVVWTLLLFVMTAEQHDLRRRIASIERRLFDLEEAAERRRRNWVRKRRREDWWKHGGKPPGYDAREDD
jgi:predicted Holliday junction resolvase-like endonuclease